MQGSPLVRRLIGLARAVVIAWIGALIVAAFLPSGGDPPAPPPPMGEPPPPCVAAVLADLVKQRKTSEEILKAVQERCKKGEGEEQLAEQPAGENWLMRYAGKLEQAAQRPGYKKVRSLFVAADQQQTFSARHAALLKILPLADTPLLRHRTHIEIAQSALRSGQPEARKIAAAAAEAAHREAQQLTREAEADAYLVDAELAMRDGHLKQSLEAIAQAIDNDPGYLAAHLLRLNAIVMLAPQAGEADKLRYLDQGIESAYHIRKLTDRSYVVDARSAIAEYAVQSDVAALLQFFLGSLADDPEGARRRIAAFLAQCGSGLTCAPGVRARALKLLE